MKEFKYLFAAGAMLVASGPVIAAETTFDFSKPLSGEYSCRNGAKTYGAVFSFVKKGESLFARQWISTFGNASGARPYVNVHDTVFRVEDGPDGVLLSPARELANNRDIASIDAITLRQNSTGSVSGEEEGCVYNLSPLETITSKDLPQVLGSAPVHSANVGFSTSLLLFSDEYGTFVSLDNRQKTTCIYSISGENGTYTRTPLFALDDCSQGQLELSSDGNGVWIGADGRGTKIKFQAADKYAARLAEVTQVAQQQKALEATSISDFVANAQGEYGAKLSTGMGYADYLVSVTPSGVRIDVDGVPWRCEYVVEPETSEVFLVGKNGSSCGGGQFQGARDPDNGDLTFALSSNPKPVTLPFISGDMGEGWTSKVPEVAVIKGIALGDKMPTTDAEIPGYTRIQDRGQLSRFSRSSMGMMGVTNSTNYFESATYLKASAPQKLPDGSGSISFDDLGVYGVNGKVVAVFRYQEPQKEQAPRFEAVTEALLSSYGTPTITDRSGAGYVYEWHFAPNGTLLDAKSGQNCQSRFTSDYLDSRFVLLEREKLETSLTEIYQGKPARIEPETKYLKLRVSSECGFSIRYHIHPSEEGLLRFMQASMYAYDPVRSEIWSARREKLDAEIKKDLELQKTSQAVSPDL
ncbi:MAG: hypothetical protein ACRBBT_05950 [Paracoccaceae bacterium]